MATDNQEDCWAVFGSDDDSNGSKIEGDCKGAQQDLGVKAASESALFLAKTLLHQNSKVLIHQRRIGLFLENSKNGKDTRQPCECWKKALQERGFLVEVVSPESDTKQGCYDAVVWVLENDDASQSLAIYNNLVRGGLCLVVMQNKVPLVVVAQLLETTGPRQWRTHSSTETHHDSVFTDPYNNLHVIWLQKSLTQIQDRSCLWLSPKHSLLAEQQRVDQATISISSFEIQHHELTEPSIAQAVTALQQYGYCILPGLLDPGQSLAWGNAVLTDLHHASQILLEQGVDIFHPHSSQNDPQSYRELSMREDLRMDLRDGPKLKSLRRGENKPVFVKSNSTISNSSENPFLQQHPSVLEIARRAMNPKKGNLYKGNFGRYNFEGSGPDGTFQDMRLSAVGGIVSLPGAADQALHADTPHLFECATLPVHYINAFTLGCHGDPSVGCTAFVHGSHHLEFTAQYLAENVQESQDYSSPERHDQVFEFLVRPRLELGDVVLFDCRVLHFGLANMSQTIERPLLYCNMTHAWFHDPKNWDNRHPIFDIYE